MNLKDKINQDLIISMKAKEHFKVSTLRSLNAVIKQVEVDTREDVSEPQVLSILQKQIKQRKESLKIYQDNDREDLASIEQQELIILEDYLPNQMSEEDLESLVKRTLKDLGASSMKDMGNVMLVLKLETSGKADFSKVSTLVKKYLS